MQASDIVNFTVTEHLRDQRPLTIRTIHPDDKGLMIDALREISPESLYFRFFSGKRNFTADELKQATEVDFVNVVPCDDRFDGRRS